MSRGCTITETQVGSRKADRTAGDIVRTTCYSPRMAALRKHAPAHMTLPEFLSRDAAEPSGVAWQLIDGEPVAMAQEVRP